MQTTIPNNESIQVQQEGHWNWQTVQYTLHCPKMVREEAAVHSPVCEKHTIICKEKAGWLNRCIFVNLITLPSSGTAIKIQSIHPSSVFA